MKAEQFLVNWTSKSLTLESYININDNELAIDYQDYQDPSIDSTVTDGHRQGKKA